MLALSLALLCQGGVTVLALAASTGDVWHGTMSYPCTAECKDAGPWLSHEAPINITVDSASGLASVSWMWTVLPGPGGVKHCVVRTEEGLKVTAAADGQWLAKGDGTPSAYYSLEAKLSAAGDALIEGIIYFSKGGKWPGTAAGNFTAKKGAAPAKATCVPPPPAPPAPPRPPRPPPSPPYTGPNLWPLPANLSTGEVNVSLAPDFAFHCDGWAVGSLLPTALTRFHSLIFAEPRGGSGAPSSDAQLAGLSVHVDSTEERKTLQLGMDESYSLTIPSSGTATLRSPTVSIYEIQQFQYGSIILSCFGLKLVCLDAGVGCTAGLGDLCATRSLGLRCAHSQDQQCAYADQRRTSLSAPRFYDGYS